MGKPTNRLVFVGVRRYAVRGLRATVWCILHTGDLVTCSSGRNRRSAGAAGAPARGPGPPGERAAAAAVAGEAAEWAGRTPRGRAPLTRTTPDSSCSRPARPALQGQRAARRRPGANYLQVRLPFKSKVSVPPVLSCAKFPFECLRKC